MIKIYKYDLFGYEGGERISIWHDMRLDISMPKHSVLLHASEQNGIPRIWAMVNTEMQTVKRRIVSLGTGEDIPPEVAGIIARDPSCFVGTFLSRDFVWHIYDLGEVNEEEKDPTTERKS